MVWTCEEESGDDWVKICIELNTDWTTKKDMVRELEMLSTHSRGPCVNQLHTACLEVSFHTLK